MDFPDNFFDRVISSLLLHHLTAENKRRTLAEIFRVLKPGGALHVADWGKAQNVAMRGAFFLVQMFDGFATTTENVQGKLPDYFREAGFANVKETQRYMTVYGTLSLYVAKRAG
ncbi:methyltransferase domain-containing protein [candidate division KSB1 bacterium]|nr:methyltransferase domain-containing protein [candidate division KSB1 bacterium]